MLIPFLKIPAHYSASDRAGLKRLEKNSKIKKRKQWGLAKKIKPPQKKESFKKKDFKKESLRKKIQKKRKRKLFKREKRVQKKKTSKKRV